MNRDVKPYWCPDAASVRFDPWKIRRADGWYPLPEALPDWDPATNLVFGRDVDLELDDVVEQARLPRNASLRVVVEWLSSSSGLRGLGANVPVERAGTRVEVTVPGAEVSGSLVLLTRLILGSDVEGPRAPYTAGRAGEVLFEDAAECRLQGVGSLFPISVVDFAAMRLPAAARWHLLVPTELGRPVMGGLRLYLNAADGELVAAANHAGNPSKSEQALLTFLRLDVTRQLVDIALGTEHVHDLEEYDDQVDSFGGMLRQLLRDLFGDDPPEALSRQRESEPQVFATRLQAAVLQMLKDQE